MCVLAPSSVREESMLLCSCVTAPAGSFLLLCICCMALLWKIKIENRSISSLLAQYAAVKAVCWLGNRQRNKLEKDTQDVHRVQEETLLKRLRKHSDTVYGKLYDFGSIKGDWFRSVYNNSKKQSIFWFRPKQGCSILDVILTLFRFNNYLIKYYNHSSHVLSFKLLCLCKSKLYFWLFSMTKLTVYSKTLDLDVAYL